MIELEKVVLLHDGDIFAYRAAAATDGRQYVVELGEHKEMLKYKKDAVLAQAELGDKATLELIYLPEPESHAFQIIKQLLKSVKTDLSFKIKSFDAVLESEEHYLTNKGSFREVIATSYKANRKDIRRPKHLKVSKDYLRKKHQAVSRDGELEADDLLSIRMVYWQSKGYTPICISIDKDLKQRAGWHWDFVKKQLVYVDELSGYRSFYRQLLMGDTTDGIIGIKGIGPKGAEKLIDHLLSPYEMYKVCLKKWMDHMPPGQTEGPEHYIDRIVRHVRLNARLLYLLRNEDEHWVQPEENDEENTKSVTTIQGL
jgi:hypothetical protein